MSVIVQIVWNANCLHRIAKINYYNYWLKNPNVIAMNSPMYNILRREIDLVHFFV